MLDKVFALVGTVALVAFMGIVSVYVMEPDLLIVTIIVLVVAIYFIFEDLKGGDSHLKDEQDGDEA